MARFKVLRGISVAMKAEDETARTWEAGDTLTDAPKTAIKDWLAIGAIEPMGDAPAPAPAREAEEEVSGDG